MMRCHRYLSAFWYAMVVWVKGDAKDLPTEALQVTHSLIFSMLEAKSNAFFKDFSIDPPFSLRLIFTEHSSLGAIQENRKHVIALMK